jgi:trans-feruloyl-CoA hydratase/vanillin synthase
MAENYQTLLVSKEAGITTIMFNRPEKRNAMSPQLHREMYQVLTELRYDQQTKVVIITGAGDNFCAGQDLKQYGLEMGSQPQSVQDDIREKVRKWRTELLRNLPQPTIARITGWCLGGALTVTVGCDVAIASEDAQLISKAVPRAELDNEVNEFAKCLAEKSPLALKAVKESWYLSTATAAETGFAISNFISQRIVRDQGGRPGLEQFVEKKLRPVSEAMKLEKK